MMSNFLLNEARDKADAIWDEKGYTDEPHKQILNKNEQFGVVSDYVTVGTLPHVGT
jgi:hypothetical protein